MANRQFGSQFSYGFERMPVRLYARVSFGVSGAPTLDTNIKQGVASISRTSAGLYVLTLQDVYNRLLALNIMQLSGASPETAPIRHMVSHSVSSAKTITFQYLAVDNSTATDPASGEQASIEIVLSNSSVTK